MFGKYTKQAIEEIKAKNPNGLFSEISKLHKEKEPMKEDKICVTNQFFRDIVIYAFRYAITRKSYAGSLFQDWLIDNLDIVSIDDIRLMIKEIDEAIDHNLLTDIELVTWPAFKNTLIQLRIESE
jgi:hypothetical protein